MNTYSLLLDHHRENLAWPFGNCKASPGARRYRRQPSQPKWGYPTLMVYDIYLVRAARDWIYSCRRTVGIDPNPRGRDGITPLAHICKSGGPGSFQGWLQCARSFLIPIRIQMPLTTMVSASLPILLSCSCAPQVRHRAR
jgi:hypothetical protein